MQKSKPAFTKFIPTAIGSIVGATLFLSIGWWGFLILFPWIGASISLGIHLRQILPKKKKTLGRRISILLILPALLIFVPLANRENFQLEGVLLIVLAGYFSKGFIHYAVAKLFGPLIWGRGFCGWACWTAAVLDWLPIKKEGVIKPGIRRMRYLALLISTALPLYLVLVHSYDVREDYINKAELAWMVGGNIVYYLMAIPLAFWFRDRRAFCKMACPVSLVMKVPTRFAKIRRKPTGHECTDCGICSTVCLMDVDVRSFIHQGKAVSSTECILCNTCVLECPSGAIK